MATGRAEGWKRKEGAEISELEARAVVKRECPKVEGKRKRKGIPATSQQGKPRSLGCYSLRHCLGMLVI